jgi:hypothetical protein
MMDLTNRQWLKYAVMHPFEGFEDMRWKKAGSIRYSIVIVLLWFVAAVFYNRLYGFQFYASPDKLFNVIPYIVRTIVLFLTWVVGNWAVCTLLEGEGTMRNIFIYSAYALVPYVASLFIGVLLSHVLIRDEAVFIDTVYILGLGWSAVLVFSAIRATNRRTDSYTQLITDIRRNTTAVHHHARFGYIKKSIADLGNTLSASLLYTVGSRGIHLIR